MELNKTTIKNVAKTAETALWAIGNLAWYWWLKHNLCGVSAAAFTEFLASIGFGFGMWGGIVVIIIVSLGLALFLFLTCAYWWEAIKQQFKDVFDTVASFSKHPIKNIISGIKKALGLELTEKEMRLIIDGMRK